MSKNKKKLLCGILQGWRHFSAAKISLFAAIWLRAWACRERRTQARTRQQPERSFHRMLSLRGNRCNRERGLQIHTENAPTLRERVTISITRTQESTSRFWGNKLPLRGTIITAKLCRNRLTDRFWRYRALRCGAITDGRPRIWLQVRGFSCPVPDAGRQCRQPIC